MVILLVVALKFSNLADEALFSTCLDFIPRANKELKLRLGLKNTYENADERIGEFGLSNVKHMIRNNFEGSIDTGKMMRHLLKIAFNSGIKIINGLEVNDFSADNAKVKIAFKNGLEIESNKLHIATNGFASQLLPNINVKPARAQVLITSEIEGLKLDGTFHMNEGYYYFRNVGKRVLLGGGRELDFEGETSTELETTELIQNKLTEILGTVILPTESFTIEHAWAGVMGVGPVKQTIVKRLSENVSCSVRLGGMGIAIGTSIGKQAADLIK